MSRKTRLHHDPEKAGSGKRNGRTGRPKGTGGKAQELTTDEIGRIEKCMVASKHQTRNLALLHLGLGSGMRISEIVNLDIQDIAPSGRVGNHVVLEKHSTKSKRSRTVAISRQAVRIVQDYLHRGFPPPARHRGPLFPSQKDPKKPMFTTNAIMILKRMFAAVGVSNASSHSLRRTHANTLRRQGADLMLIKEQLGHASIETTSRYFAVDPIELHCAVDLLRF